MSLFDKYCSKIESFIPDLAEAGTYCQDFDLRSSVEDFAADYICDREGYSDAIRPAAKRIANYFCGEPE